MTMESVSQLFDIVPECMIKTLLIVHGSGDRNSIEFTHVCERWTCILAPWIRTLRKSEWSYGKEHARWNGKLYTWGDNDQLRRKGVYVNGKKEGDWREWYPNSQLLTQGVYANNKGDAEWRWWYENGQLWEKGVYVNDKQEGLWQWWYNNSLMYQRGVYANGEREGVWRKWNENGTYLGADVYHTGFFVWSEFETPVKY